MNNRKYAKMTGVYGKPLLKAGDKAVVNSQLLRKAAAILLKSVKREIRRDMEKAKGLRGGTWPKPYSDRDPVPIPQGEAFIRSFHWKIKGESSIEIWSSWPTAEAHTVKPTTRGLNAPVPGKPAQHPDKGIPMTWLVQPKVKYVPIITENGQVIIRTAPLKTADAWIHPGFTRYTFIERGIRKGRVEVVKQLKDEIVSAFLAQGSLF